MTKEIRVHVLHHGRSYCLKRGVPSEWPEGHRWVPVRDYKEQANCNDCLRVLLNGAILCAKCDAVLVDGHRRMIAENIPVDGDIHCYPRCP